MKIKLLNILAVIIILFTSCKKEKFNKVKISHNTNLQKNKIKLDTIPQIEQKKIIEKSINKADSITSNENLLDILTKYKKLDTIYWIEGAEFKNSKEKIIYYGIFYEKNNLSNDINFTFLINKKGNLSFISNESSIGSGKERKIISKDTFFFKNNKIYFWKNKQATKEELLKKEQEILAIKKEIDSIMKW